MKSIESIIKGRVAYRREYDVIWEIDFVWNELDIFNYRVLQQ